MGELGGFELIGAIITANVTIVLGAFALVRKMLSNQTPPPLNPTCLLRIENFMTQVEKGLVEANRIQHTQARYLNDVRQELSHLRTEVSELKGRIG